MNTFFEVLSYKSKPLCVGLDFTCHDKDKVSLSKHIIDETSDYVSCYKINPAFFPGPKGSHEIEDIAEYLDFKEKLWIYDGKRGDVKHTSTEYAKYIYEALCADGTTLNPFLGLDALEPFLKYTDKGNFLLCRTSNPLADVYQNYCWSNIAKYAVNRSNIGLVVAGNKERYIKEVRSVNENSWFLSPGIGAQGGSINNNHSNILYSISRSIINSDNPKEAISSYTVHDIFYKLNKINCIKKNGPYKLSNGKVSDYYIDMRSITHNPEVFKELVEELSTLYNELEADGVVGVATAGITYATGIALKNNIPLGYIRSKKKSHGACNDLEGGLKNNSKLVVLDDVVTSGTSVIKSIISLREKGFIVNDVICICIRDKDALSNLENIGIKLHYLFSI
tara:strand:- start:550 stop:1728 length:1179 start_codon:yes stop_codon:yes gene_type:complete